jgi:NADP-dependent 3-hydroxy acid dehydrogenase YdfG
MTEQTLSGRVAVVTGASSGIGEATARALSAQGAAVAVLARRTDRLDALVADLEADGGTARAYACDVTDADAVRTVLGRVVADLGGIDVLVNNAGVAHQHLARDADLADWQQMVDVNLTGVLATTHSALEHLFAAAAGEHGVADVVTISSASGRRVPQATSNVYAATKHAVGAFSEALRRELGPQHVRVGLVEPGFVRTELTAGHDFEPLGALEAADVADAVVWMVTRPRRTAVNEVLMRPIEQDS